MRKLLRIVVIIEVTLGVIAVGVFWVAPVGISIWTARKLPRNASVVPRDLRDRSISPAPGEKLSYFGYEFEVPWNDLEATKTKLRPAQNPNRVEFIFRSGLQMSATALPPKELLNGVASAFQVSPQVFEAVLGAEFGRGAAHSDYDFARSLYEFTPAKMHRWSITPSVHYREGLLLTVKSVSLVRWADSGIFNVRNQTYRGFQQGDPGVRQNGLAVELYSDENGIEFLFNQKDYINPAGISQAEINRIVQSLRRVSPVESSRATKDKRPTP